MKGESDLNREAYLEFKRQLLEYILSLNGPFTAKQLLSACNMWINPATLYNALAELEEENKIIMLKDGRYLSAPVAVKKWIRKLYEEVELPRELYDEIVRFLDFTPFKSVEEFVKEAVRRLILSISIHSLESRRKIQKFQSLP